MRLAGGGRSPGADIKRRSSQPLGPTSKGGTKMAGRTTILLYAALLVAVIVAVDVLFFRNRPWERLAVNIGLVLVFGAFYFRFLNRP